MALRAFRYRKLSNSLQASQGLSRHKQESPTGYPLFIPRPLRHLRHVAFYVIEGSGQRKSPAILIF